MNDAVYYICGIFNFGFALFHVFFWQIFSWKTGLRSLTPVNRGIMQIMNVCLIYIFACFGTCAVYYSSDLLESGPGRALLLAISIFWFMRGFGQIIFFDWKKTISKIFFVIFLAGGVLHLYPLIS
jgi:hypothetical protein